MPLFIGCDPGKTGYLAAIDHTGDDFGHLPLPFNGPQPDTRAMYAWWRTMDSNYALTYGDSPKAHATIEHVNSFGMGRQSAFVFGQGFGALQAWMETRGFAVQLVTPKVWQSEIFKGLPKREDNSVIYTRRRWPHVNLTPGKCTKPKDGLADALCMAEYLRRQVMR